MGKDYFTICIGLFLAFTFSFMTFFFYFGLCSPYSESELDPEDEEEEDELDEFSPSYSWIFCNFMAFVSRSVLMNLMEFPITIS